MSAGLSPAAAAASPGRKDTSTQLPPPRGQDRAGSRRFDAARRLRRARGALAALLLLVVIVVIALLADVIAPFDPIRIDPAHALYSPGLPYLFGSDQFGRDVLSRVVFGSRVSLLVGPIAVGIALVPGVAIGLLAGFHGHWVDGVLMRVVDVMLAFPGILLALGIVAVLGPSLTSLMVAVGISSIPTYARLTRGGVLSAREQLYVDAARVIGASDTTILVRHILPNVVAPIIIVATLGVGSAILIAATLSFLGLGSQPPTPEWGRMLSEGRQYLREQWWIATFPGLAIMLTVLALNMLGDGLRDALDPRLQV
jgi:peptide/nickel transport system permease protein